MTPWGLVMPAGLFSATQTEAVQALARAGLRNQVRVNVAIEPIASTSGRLDGHRQPTLGSAGNLGSDKKKKPAMQDQRTPSGLEASYLVCQSDGKLAQLLYFLGVRLLPSVCTSSEQSISLDTATAATVL